MPGAAIATGTSPPAVTSSFRAAPPAAGASVAAVVPGGSANANGAPAATDGGARRWDQATMLSIRAGKAASWGRFDSEGSNAITATRLPPSVPEAISGPSALHAAAVIVAGRASRRAAPAPIVSEEMSAPSSSGLAASVPLRRLSRIVPRSCP